MKKLTSLLAAALALAGCSGGLDAQKVRDAMPKAASVQLQAPAPDGSAAPVALHALAATGDLASPAASTPPYVPQSTFATISYWSAVGINGGTWWTLTLVKFVTDHKATDCDDTSCTWGPWRGDDGLNDWKLHVTKSDGGYNWVFEARNAVVPGSAWVALISGHAVPGADANHGSGNFLIDFEKQASLAHGPGWVQRDFGTVEITYDNTAGVFVNATALGGHNSDPGRTDEVMNANYAFSKTGPGGQIQIAVHNLTTHEAVKLNTRWKGGTAYGAGRGDAIWSNDDGANWVPSAPPPYLTQCWNGADASWAETFDNTISYPTISVGTAEAVDCVFTTGQAPTIAVP
jgi:hypothetical protein